MINEVGRTAQTHTIPFACVAKHLLHSMAIQAPYTESTAIHVLKHDVPVTEDTKTYQPQRAFSHTTKLVAIICIMLAFAMASAALTLTALSA